MNEISSPHQDLPEELVKNLRILQSIYQDLRIHSESSLSDLTLKERKRCVDFLETLIREEKDYWKQLEQKEFDKRQLDLFPQEEFL